MSMHKNLITLCCAVAFALGLAACSSSDDPAPPPPPPPPVDPGPSAYEVGKAAIMAAMTEADAQAAYDAVDLDEITAQEAMNLLDALNNQLAMIAAANAYTDGKAAIMAATTAADAQAAYDAIDQDAITGEQASTLQDLLDDQLEIIAAAGLEADQKMALMNAAGMIDTSDLSTQANVDAANAAIAGLKAALAAATAVSDADKAMYQAMVAAGEAAVMTAQATLDHTSQTAALSAAVMALQAIDLSDLSDQAKIDAAQAAIDAAQMALDAATELSGAEKASAMAVLATANLNVMTAQGRLDLAGQMTALANAVAALEAIDFDNLMTQEQIDAAEEAIIALDLALEAADDLTDAQKLDATVDVTVAKRRVASAQTALDENVGNQRMALMDAGTALAAIDLADLDTQDKIDAADAAVDALEMALNAATHLSDSEKAMYQEQLDTATETVRTAQTGMDRDERMMTQRTAITDAVTMAQTTVGMVDDDATDAEVTAADNAIAALKAAIEGAEDLPEGDTDVAMAQGTLSTLEGLLADAKESRMMALAEQEKMDIAAMAVTASKLHAGISLPTAADNNTADTDAATGTRFAQYVATADDPTGASVGDLEVAIGAADDVALSEDEDAMVADHYGWEGSKYTRTTPATDGMYEAIVYSNVGEPTEGMKFGSPTADDDYQYTLNAGDDNTELTMDDTNAGADWEERVASSSFDHSAGVKEFELGTNMVRVMIPGSYHGVSGTYNCTPAASSTCAVQVATDGFNLGGTADADNAFTAGGGTWTFKPGNREDRLMDAPDGNYVSYGWWIHKAADDGDFTASVFVTNRGTGEDAATGIDTLNGTATYMGGAAGKYALRSSTGGTNDAGHFTARTTLEADFTDNEITGTIDNFMGADGMARDWSVELMESGVGATGIILGADGTGTPMMTEWTIGEEAADEAGQWQGTLWDNGDDGVPQVGTGTFYSEYGTEGRMIGAFGVNVQQ